MMPPKKKRNVLSYSHEELLKALEAMKNGESASSVSKRFDIPRSTLIYKLSGKTPLDRRMGPPPVLGVEAEAMLKNWVMALAVRGFPVTKQDLITSVEQISKDLNLNLKNAFPNGKPGYKWLSLFLKRHPEIAERTVEKLSKVRANVTENFIRTWFEEVKNHLESNDMLDVVSDPKRVFNMDETAFFLCPKGEKVLGIRGQRNVYEINQGNEKENLTVLCNVNAGGQVAPTLIVFPGQRLPQALRLDVPEEWAISKSESGWINGEIFFEYFANDFYRWLLDQGVTFPVVVFLDGHKSHLTYHLSKFCSNHNIILIALPANCTHVLQPLDVAVFKPVKSGWARSVHKWRMKQDGARLTKYNFASMLKDVLDQAVKETTLANGFKICGLCPLDPNAVDYTKVDVLNNTVTKVLEKKRPSSLCLTEEVTAHSEGAKCIAFIERFIDPELLKEFNKTYEKFTPIWQGPDTAHDLYVAWKKAKDFVSYVPNIADTSSAPSNSNKSSTCDALEPAVVSRSTEPQYITTSNLTSPSTPSKETSKFVNPPVTVQLACASPAPSTSGTASARTPNTNVCNTSRETLAKVLSPETNGSNVPSPFKNHLFWPGTPTKTKKTGKKDKVKLPSVITSKDWQAYEEKKREEKKLEEEKKAERKRLREEKRNKKPQKKKRTKKQLVFDEEEDWVCRVCGKRYSAEIITKTRRRWIECDECGHAYHYMCIPKKHLDVYGIEEEDEDDDEVAFVCHQCCNDSETDEEQ